MSKSTIDSAGTINNAKANVGATTTYSGVTSTQLGSAFTIAPAKAMSVAVNVTSLTGTVQIQLQTQRKDGSYFPIWHSAVLSATGKLVYDFGPGGDVDLRLDGSMTLRLAYLVIGTATFTASVAGN